MTKLDPSDITAEKSLWEIWNTARRIRRVPFNRNCTAATVVALAVYVLLSKQSPHEIAEMIRAWAIAGLGFSSTILGFLVAGFTIFATLSKPSLLASMAIRIQKQSGISYLKYNFFIFFETFGWYAGFAGLCVLVLVFGASGGAVAQLVHALPESVRHAVELIVCRSAAVIFGGWFVLLCLELKSFIFNIYHVVMTSIRWTVERPEGEACRYVPPKDLEDHQTSSAANLEK